LGKKKKKEKENKTQKVSAKPNTFPSSLIILNPLVPLEERETAGAGQPFSLCCDLLHVAQHMNTAHAAGQLEELSLNLVTSQLSYSLQLLCG